MMLNTHSYTTGVRSFINCPNLTKALITLKQLSTQYLNKNHKTIGIEQSGN